MTTQPPSETPQGLLQARREIDSALSYLPQECVIQHEDPYAAMALTFNKLAHERASLTAKLAEAEAREDELIGALIGAACALENVADELSAPQDAQSGPEFWRKEAKQARAILTK